MERLEVAAPVSAAQKAAGLGMILASTVLVAAVPNFAKLAYDAGASVLFVLVGRFLVSVLLLGVALLLLRGGFATTRRALRLCALGGVATALMSFGVLSAIVSIDISLAILIVYLHPVMIAWFGHLHGTYTMTPSRALYCVLTLVGLALALAVQLESLDPVGIALGFLGAFGAAGLVILSGQATSETGAMLVNFYTSLVALILLGLAALVAGDVAPPEAALGWFGVFATGAAFCVGLVLFFAAIPILGMVRAALISVIEPLIAILIAMMLFGEHLQPLQWLGVAIVILGLGLLELPPQAFARLRRAART